MAYRILDGSKLVDPSSVASWHVHAEGSDWRIVSRHALDAVLDAASILDRPLPGGLGRYLVPRDAVFVGEWLHVLERERRNEEHIPVSSLSSSYLLTVEAACCREDEDDEEVCMDDEDDNPNEDEEGNHFLDDDDAMPWAEDEPSSVCCEATDTFS